MSSDAVRENGYVQARRAIEALRSGVPNRDAVRALGSAQAQVEARFREQLDAANDDVANATQTPGLLVAGDFGAGKSHLLEYLEHLALEQSFVCSKIVISKETPLHDPGKLYRAAVEAAVVPGKKGTALPEIAASLRVNSRAYDEFYAWAHSPDSGLNARFPASVYLYERVRDPEVRDRIVASWGGDPLNIGEVRAWLRAQGEAATYRLEKLSLRELPQQLFSFTPRLIVAAGYAGWVLLVDEVELIGRYSFRQRARSYAELARWLGRLEGEAYPGLTSVFAITSDFATEVLERRNDEETIPGRLRASGLDADGLLASRAERGMRVIARERVDFKPPSRELIEQTQARVQELHARAYRWEPPALGPVRGETTMRMREYVKRWINEWDLRRLYPDRPVETVVSDLKLDYSEDRSLETASEEDSPGA